MTNYKVGFIGAGNMAQAIFKGAISGSAIKASNVYIYDIDVIKTEELSKSNGVNKCDSINELTEQTDIIILSVKPNILDEVLEYLNELKCDLNLVSIVAGWSGEKILSYFNNDDKISVLRTMPNMPLQCGQGMTVFEVPSNFSSDMMSFVRNIFHKIGLVSEQKAGLMDTVTSISGSGPAYAFMFIEALADAGVLNGLSRNDSILLAAQTLLGSAQLVLDSGTHPAKLKDAICSPGGTTIEAVKVLEQKGFRSSIIDAADACKIKSSNL